MRITDLVVRIANFPPKNGRLLLSPQLAYNYKNRDPSISIEEFFKLPSIESFFTYASADYMIYARNLPYPQQIQPVPDQPYTIPDLHPIRAGASYFTPEEVKRRLIRRKLDSKQRLESVIYLNGKLNPSWRARVPATYVNFKLPVDVFNCVDKQYNSLTLTDPALLYHRAMITGDTFHVNYNP